MNGSGTPALGPVAAGAHAHGDGDCPVRAAVSIAIVRARYNPYGGAERFVQRAFAALAAQGVELTIVARDWPKGTQETQSGHDLAGAVPLKFLRVDPFHIGSVWRDWSFALGVRKALRGGGYHLIQSHERIPGLPVFRAGDGVHADFLAQRRRALPAWRAAMLHANPYHAYTLAAERAMFRHPALKAVICNSDMVRAQIRQRFGVADDKLLLIRNGVDLVRFRPPDAAERAQARAALGVEPGVPVFAFVGSGFERKGLAAAIDAMGRLPAGSGAILLVAGTDRRARAYRARAARGTAADRIRFLGGVDDVRPVLWASDAFVLPTLYDPFPNAVLEALACGLPVIGSTGSGASELLRDGINGFVTDALDVDAIARAMQALSDPARQAQMARAARVSAEPCSLDAMAASLIALYRRLIESAPT